MTTTHKAACFCGAVTLEVKGAPAAMGYCHCTDCRSWSAGPVNAFALWNPEDVAVTSGADEIATYNKTENSYRKWCRQCGGHLMAEHPGMKMVDVYASLLPTLAFEPAFHVFYGEKLVSIRDGLPKLNDVPADMGGSGEVLPE